MMANDRYGKANGFTLVELLVVVAVVALLIALLLPALTKARYHANLTACMSNLRQLGFGVMTYAADTESRYPLRLGIWKDEWSALNAIKDHRSPPNDDRPRLKPYMDLIGRSCGASRSSHRATFFIAAGPDDSVSVQASHRSLFFSSLLPGICRHPCVGRPDSIARARWLKVACFLIVTIIGACHYLRPVRLASTTSKT